MGNNGVYTLQNLKENPITFVNHAKSYLKENREIPKLYRKHGDNDLFITLSDALLKKITDDSQESINDKLYPFKVALFADFTNEITPIRIKTLNSKDDLVTYSETLSLIKKYKEPVKKSLKIEDQNIKDLIKVLIEYFRSKDPLLGAYIKQEMFILDYLQN